MLGKILKRKNQINKDDLKEQIIAALRTVFDPEIPVNIYDLGLIYDVILSEAIDPDGVIIENKYDVDIKMTLTTPGCPVAQTFPLTVENEVKQVEGVKNAVVEIVWDPPWTQECMTEAARLQLGLY